MKYILLFDNNYIEFIDQQSAINFCVANSIIKFNILSEQEYKERILAKKKREYGLYISNEMIELLGARNKILNLNATQVTQMLSQLSGVRSLLETGALGTARTYMVQLKAVFINHSDIFDDGIEDINIFEQENGL